MSDRGHTAGDDVLEKATAREADLAAHADLYERIHTFMEGLSKETYAAYDAVRDKPECTVLMDVHRTVLAIKSDYRGLVAGNREDVEIYAALRARHALALAGSEVERA